MAEFTFGIGVSLSLCVCVSAKLGDFLGKRFTNTDTILQFKPRLGSFEYIALNTTTEANFVYM